MGFVKYLKIFPLLFFSFELLASSQVSTTRVDPSLIIDKEKFLEFLKDPEMKDYFFPNKARPGKCPFKSYTHDQLILQLKDLATALRSSRCESNNPDLVVNLHQMASVLRNTLMINNGIQKGGLIYAVPDITQYTSPPAPVMPSKPEPVKLPSIDGPREEYSMYWESTQLHSKELLQQLMAATADPKCVEDLHHTGLLSAVADIAINVGQMALFIPGQNGLALGFGTLALAGTFKVVSALLKSPYNWSLEKDRMHFLNLNCNFFDLRKELEEADFFNTRNGTRKLKVKKGKEFVEVLERKLHELTTARDRFDKNILDTQDHFFSLKIGKNKIELYRLLVKIQKNLATSIELDPEARYKLTKEIADISPKMIPLISSEFQEGSGPYILELLKPFTEKSLTVLDSLKLPKFKSHFIHPLSMYFKNIHEEIEKDLKFCVYDYEKERVNENEINRDVIERGQKVFKKAIALLTDRKVQLQRRIFLYEAKERKDMFGVSGTGAHMDFDVLKEYSQTRDIIFGKRGWGFLDYLIKSAEKDSEDFLINYKKWEHKYPVPEKLSRDMTVWACRDAQDLRVKWNSAFSAIGLAHDFYETNKGILNSEFKTTRNFFHLIPGGKSEKMKIFGNIRSLEMAKSILDGESTYTKGDVKQAFYKRNHSNLGELALKVKEFEVLRDSIDGFFKEQDCLLHI